MNIADMKATWATSIGQAIELVEMTKGDDVYQRGRVMVVVPGIWSGMDHRLLEALVIRRVTTLAGRCPRCQALPQLGDLGGGGAGTGLAEDLDLRLRFGEVWHGPGCPGDGGQLARLVRRCGGLREGYRLVDPDPAGRVIKGRELWEVNKVGMRVGKIWLDPDRRPGKGKGRRKVA